MAQKSLELVDVDKPNLYRDVFPYSQFPKVVFDDRKLEYEIPDNIWITDTTFRDGQQARPPYAPEQILRIFDLLHEIDGGTGLIRQCEFFLYSKRDRKAVELCKERGYKYPEITGWIRAVASDFRLVSQMGLTETGILTLRFFGIRQTDFPGELSDFSLSHEADREMGHGQLFRGQLG